MDWGSSIFGRLSSGSEDWLCFAYPCGVCRQVLAEFCSPKDFLVLLENAQGERKALTLGELLPYGFVLKD